jgi:GGDEF domain-containing protein
LEHRKKLFAKLDSECANTRIEETGNSPISIARGFARFNPDSDQRFHDVFKRADDAMYENKRKLKESMS